MYLMTPTDHPSMASPPHFVSVSQPPNWAGNLYLGRHPYSTTGHACQKTNPENTSRYPMLNHRPHTTRTPGRLPTDVLQLLASPDSLPRVILSSVTEYNMQPCLAPSIPPVGLMVHPPLGYSPTLILYPTPILGTTTCSTTGYDCQMTR